MPIDLTTLTAREAITAVYIGYYDRAPDPTGLNFWVGVLNDGFDLNNNGDSLDDIASNYAGQEETLQVHTFFTNPTDASASAFVTELYSNLFNRAPDDAGLAFWTGQLQDAIAGTGSLTVGEIILEIIKGAQGDDITIIMNKIEVGLDWNDSADAAGIVYAGNDAAAASASSVLDNVDSTDASVVAAKAATDAFVSANEPGTPSVPGDTFILSHENGRDNLSGTEGDDTFEAYNTETALELNDGDRMDGGAGSDTLTLHNSAQNVPAIAAITTSVETVVVTNQTNDRDSDADNNVGGYGFDDTVEVDVELDAGQMSGVTRWEDYDSRADLVIEDARDQDDTDGTFTGDITVAMVSTDPGNVDFAVYFDQPVNVSQNFGTLELRVLDQEAATGLPAPSAGSTGYLTESSLISFKFTYDDTEIEVTLADELGVTYGPDVSFSDLLVQVQNSTAAALVEAGVTDLNFSASLGAPVQIGVGNQFTLPIVLTFDVTADEISANSDNIVVQGRDQNNDNATDVAGSLSTDRTTTEELIRLNVELDDVGKGSMGGDAMFGAMSTGRQGGDDGTSDSIGIQQFDIEVDRSSQLQTINSTNNSLEVVNITNGENDGPNNTTTAADEMAGDLVVRGQANSDDFADNTGEDVDTDGAMPGAVPQHNSYGFSDVRVINAAAMVGAVDITAELTEETVEKYLDIQDSQSDGEVDDVDFQYSLGNNNDEFLLNMDSGSLQSAGTGSREDFDLTISGGAGNDVITTNIGFAQKRIDEQGQDHYQLNDAGAGTTSWYTNAVSNVAAELTVNGGTGNDTIWTHGTGDFTISDGTGMDVVYTDNSAAVEAHDTVAPVIDRNLTEHDQIDYVAGAVWAFNAEGPFGAGLTGATNETIDIATGAVLTTPTSGFATITVSYFGANGAAGTAGSANAGTAYTVTANVPFSELSVSATGVVSIDEQALNQAIKAGINGDAILSNLLEAADGPGNSLVVVAKSDGQHVAADLDVEVTAVSVNATAATVTPLTNAGYTTPIFDDLTGSGAGDSFAESDNTIRVAGDSANDLFVLSTSDTAAAQITVNTALDALSDLNFASNETLIFASNFGTDTIMNFDDGTNAGGAVTGGATAAARVDGSEDVLDFTLVTGVTTNTYVSTGLTNELTAADADGTIDLIDLSVTAVDGADANSTIDAVEVAALLGGGDLTASDHIVIIRDSTGIDSTVSSVNNAGQVWHIVDGAGTSDVTATQIGTINLVGTDWTMLTVDNFA